MIERCDKLELEELLRRRRWPQYQTGFRQRGLRSPPSGVGASRMPQFLLPGTDRELAAFTGPLSLPSPVAIYDPSSSVLTTDGAASFASASSQYLSVASNSGLQAGGVDFWLSCWVNFATVTGEQAIAGKWGTGSEYLIELFTGKISFQINTTGAPEIQWGGAPSAGTWYHVFAFFDSVGNIQSLSINNGTPVTGSTTGSIPNTTSAFAIGAITSGAPSLFLNGSVDSVVFGKSPPGGIAGIAATIRSALYNSGNGLAAKDITAAQKTAWGVVSGWDFDGSANLISDYIGSNTLTNNNGVTFAAGPVASNTLLLNDSDTNLASTIGGSGYTLAQATAGNRGAYIASMQNALPGIRFTAANSQYMQKAFALNQPCTIWLVAKATTPPLSSFLVAGGIGNIGIDALTSTWALLGSGIPLDSGITIDGNIHVFVAVFNGVNSFLVVDGIQGIVGDQGTQALGGISLAAKSNGARACNADIGYAGCNAAAFTLSQAQQLTTWARRRFNF